MATKTPRIRIEDMPIRFCIKGNDRVFKYECEQDVEDFKAILKARPPKIVWVDEEVLELKKIGEVAV